MSDALEHLAGTALRYFPHRSDRDAADPGEETEAPPGVWFGRDEARRLYLRVAGDETGPDLRAAATLAAVVESLDKVTAAIDRFVAERGPSGSIVFGSRPKESFSVSICGFGVGRTYIEAIAVTDRSSPTRARVTVVTGEPDGYVVYRVTLEGGVPVHIDAVFT